jgi:hypothetical protein
MPSVNPVVVLITSSKIAPRFSQRQFDGPVMLLMYFCPANWSFVSPGFGKYGTDAERFG